MLTCLIKCLWLCIAQIYRFVCTFYAPMPISESSHACMLGFMSFHVYVLSFYMFTCMFLCLYAYIYASTCLCVWIYALYMFHVIFHVLVCSMPCSRAQTQAMFVMPCAIVALSLLYLSFLCFGLFAWTRSRPYGLRHCSYTLAHIKGFGSPILHIYACFLLCFMLVLAFLVLGFAMLDTLSGFMVVWLHPTPMRPCLGVTTWEALP